MWKAPGWRFFPKIHGAALRKTLLSFVLQDLPRAKAPMTILESRPTPNFVSQGTCRSRIPRVLASKRLMCPRHLNSRCARVVHGSPSARCTAQA